VLLPIAALVAGPADDELMRRGLDAAYRDRDFERAAAAFRAVLAHTPGHYGARFQLARALDSAGRPDEARPLWEAVLAAAEAIGDRETVALARARLPGHPRLVIRTELGPITVQLDAVRAPRSTQSFLDHAAKKLYDGTVFHRVIAGFMIQGGAVTPDGREKRGLGGIPLESANGLKNARGTLALARTDDPGSGGQQFFINVVDNGFLDYAGPARPGYAVFGEVIEGMEVADRIAAAPKNAAGAPVHPVIIQSVQVAP